MTHQPSPAVEAELRAVFDEMFDSIDRRDASFTDRHILDGFQYVDAGGNVVGKEEYRALFAMIEPGFVGKHDINEFRVRELAPGVAVIGGDYSVDMRFVGGRAVNATLLFTSVWVDEDGGWKCVVHQTTEKPR